MGEKWRGCARGLLVMVGDDGRLGGRPPMAKPFVGAMPRVGNPLMAMDLSCCDNGVIALRLRCNCVAFALQIGCVCALVPIPLPLFPKSYFRLRQLLSLAYILLIPLLYPPIPAYWCLCPLLIVLLCLGCSPPYPLLYPPILAYWCLYPRLIVFLRLVVRLLFFLSTEEIKDDLGLRRADNGSNFLDSCTLNVSH